MKFKNSVGHICLFCLTCHLYLFIKTFTYKTSMDDGCGTGWERRCWQNNSAVKRILFSTDGQVTNMKKYKSGNDFFNSATSIFYEFWFPMTKGAIEHQAKRLEMFCLKLPVCGNFLMLLPLTSQDFCSKRKLLMSHHTKRGNNVRGCKCSFISLE